jgi:hypothetical protein
MDFGHYKDKKTKPVFSEWFALAVLEGRPGFLLAHQIPYYYYL